MIRDKIAGNLNLGHYLELASRLSDTVYHALPVVDSDNRLLGISSLEEIHLATLSAHLRSFAVAEDLMRSGDSALKLEDRLDRAIEVFVETNLLALPVVDDTPDRRILGIVRRSDNSSTYLRHVHGTAGSGSLLDGTA